MKLTARRTLAPDLEWFRDLVGVEEKQILGLTMSAISPYQPGSLNQKLKERQLKLGRNPDVVPSTHELWCLFESADFRCSLCRSQLSITIDRIDATKGYERKNIRVLCRDCNRKLSRPKAKQQELQFKIFRAVRDCLNLVPARFPSDLEIKRKAGIHDLSGSTYFVRFLRRRWEQSISEHDI